MLNFLLLTISINSFSIIVVTADQNVPEYRVGEKICVLAKPDRKCDKDEALSVVLYTEKTNFIISNILNPSLVLMNLGLFTSTGPQNCQKSCLQYKTCIGIWYYQKTIFPFLWKWFCIQINNITEGSTVLDQSADQIRMLSCCKNQLINDQVSGRETNLDKGTVTVKEAQGNVTENKTESSGGKLSGNEAGSGGVQPSGSDAGSGGLQPSRSDAGSGGVQPSRSDAGSGGVQPSGSDAGSGGAKPSGSDAGSGGVQPPGNQAGSSGAKPPGNQAGSGGVQPPGNEAGSSGVKPSGSENGNKQNSTDKSAVNNKTKMGTINKSELTAKGKFKPSDLSSNKASATTNAKKTNIWVYIMIAIAFGILALIVIGAILIFRSQKLKSESKKNAYFLTDDEELPAEQLNGKQPEDVVEPW